MVDADLNPQVIAQVREAADIVEVVGDHVKLRRAGRRWQGLCPFHEEKTPSFSVDPERNLFYCFGCHAGGDVIGFVMQLERLEFPQAVERLARRYGVQLPPRSPEARRRSQEIEHQRSLLEEAQQWFVAQLATPAAEPARQELERRGFEPSTWADLGFGYAPDAWRELLGHLSRRHTEGAIVQAGLAVKPEEGKQPYDRFRSRLTFPIRSGDGRLVAFGGRALGDTEPKYLNSPEGPLFQKRTTLFNLDRARRAIGDAGVAVVVEGYFDCLSLHRTGFTNTVATLGTALTADHARLLRRLAPRTLLCYDADAAGQRAAATGAQVLLEAGVEVAMVVVPAGQDPDDLIREGGQRAFAQLLEQPTPLLDFLMAQLPQSKEERRRAGVRIAAMVGAARDSLVRFSLLEELASRLDLQYDVVKEWARQQPTQQRARSAALQHVPQAEVPPGEALLASLLVDESADLRQQITEVVDPGLLKDERVRRLVELAARASATAGAEEPDQPEAPQPETAGAGTETAPETTSGSGTDFTAWRDDQELSAFVAYLRNRSLPEVTAEVIRTHLAKTLRLHARGRASRLEPLIRAAENEDDADRVAELQREKIRLARIAHDLAGVAPTDRTEPEPDPPTSGR